MEEIKSIREEIRKNQENLRRNDEKLRKMEEEFNRIKEMLRSSRFIRFNENDNEMNDILNQLPVTIIGDINKLNDENKRCVICLEDFKNNDKSIYLPCFHLFHEKCITDWINMKKGFCPFCRTIINNMI